MINKKSCLLLIGLVIIISYFLFAPKSINCLMNIDMKKFSATKISEINSLESTKLVATKTDAVILLTMMRSGSSIVGTIFDERENVTYLYEPLFPFGEKMICESNTRKSALAVLRHASTCKYEKLPALYQPSDRNDIHAK